MMFPPTKILFPVDFSDRCAAVAPMVQTFTGHFEAQLTLLHVVEPLTYNDLPVYDSGLAVGQLDGYLAAELKYFDVKRLVASGDPALRIIEEAERSHTGLIMLPTHGYGRFRRFILGSVAAKVLHDARCPVWTGVHVQQIPPLEHISFQRILCAIDLGKQSCTALRYAHQFAEEFGAKLTIVHAIPTARDIPGMYVDQDWRQVLTENAKAQIEAIQNSLGSHAEVRIEADEAPSAVKNCAAALNADLLVIGRSVEEGVLGRLRTNAYSIIRQSPCPVISV
jgi:nucleotide-binding universal stress UspA family protein